MSALPDAAPLPALSTWRKAVNAVAFAFSALFSPYLVLPLGTLFVISSRYPSKRQVLLWAVASIFFSTFVPTIYVVFMVMQGKITDIHIMERTQRGGPFFVAVVSSAVGAAILWYMKLPPPVWGINLVVAVNGIVLTLITRYFKISMHVAVLSSTVMAALILAPVAWWQLAWMIPALIWARITRGRHTLWQGLAGCAVSCAVTFGVLKLLPLQENTKRPLPAIHQKARSRA